MHQTRQSRPHRDTHQPDSRRAAQPLEASTRSLLEPRFGHDFSQVRVHADAEADRLARGYDASAFAVGQDVYFRDGHYDPNSASGLHLLAHELTHTIQQRHAAPRSWASLEKGARNDSSEGEANSAATRVTLGGSASVTTSSESTVQCAPLDFLNPLFAPASSIVTEAPVIGSIWNGANSLYNTGAAGIDLAFGDGKAAREHATDAGIYAAKAVPVLGTGLGMFQATWDMLANDEGQAGGPQPTVHDMVDEWLFGEEVTEYKSEPVNEAGIDAWIANEERARAAKELFEAQNDPELQRMGRNVPMEP
jgi:Domain of unknown function (DUF4157)